MLLALTLFALGSEKLSAQSPPCSRKPSPIATRPSARSRLRASPANIRGGNLARSCSTVCRAALSGYSGTCWIGFWRQLSRVQRSGMTALSYASPGSGNFSYCRLIPEQGLDLPAAHQDAKPYDAKPYDAKPCRAEIVCRLQKISAVPPR